MKKRKCITFFIVAFTLTQIMMFQKNKIFTNVSEQKFIDPLFIAIDNQHVNFHPHKVDNKNSLILTKHIYEGLTRVNEKGEVELALAKEVHISENGRVYSFSLINSYWSNGDILTAYDFERSIKEAYKRTSKALGILECIQSQDSVSPNIWSVDHNTLIICLKRKTPNFLHMLAHPIFYPVHQRWSSSLSPSNGPFIVEDWISEHQILLKKNPFYRNQYKIKTKAICLIPLPTQNIKKEISRNKIHIAALKDSEICQNENTIQMEIPEIGIFYALVLDTGQYPWNDSISRYQLKNAIDSSNKIFEQNIPSKSNLTTISDIHLVIDKSLPEEITTFVYNQLQSNLNANIKIVHTPKEGSNIICKEYFINMWNKYSFIEEMILDSCKGNDEGCKKIKKMLLEAQKSDSVDQYEKILSSIEKELKKQTIIIPVCEIQTHMIASSKEAMNTINSIYGKS